MAWRYRSNSQNPFHSWWYNVVAVANPALSPLGFEVMLRRCEWTKSNARLTVAFVGWSYRERAGWWLLALLAGVVASFWDTTFGLGFVAGSLLFSYFPDAQGIDARSGQTEGLDPKGESPVAAGHAP